MTTSMTGFLPVGGLAAHDRVSVWGVTDYGTGSREPDAGRRVGAREGRVDDDDVGGGDPGRADRPRATGGFALAFEGEALWVGAASDLLDGPAGRLNASQAWRDAGAHGAGGARGASRPAAVGCR